MMAAILKSDNHMKIFEKHGKTTTYCVWKCHVYIIYMFN